MHLAGRTRLPRQSGTCKKSRRVANQSLHCQKLGAALPTSSNGQTLLNFLLHSLHRTTSRGPSRLRSLTVPSRSFQSLLDLASFCAAQARTPKKMAGITRLGFLVLAVTFHLVYLLSIFDVYFVSPIVSGMQLFQPERKEPDAKPPADRLVLFVGMMSSILSEESFPPPCRTGPGIVWRNIQY